MGEGGCVFIFVAGQSSLSVGGCCRAWAVALFVGSHFRLRAIRVHTWVHCFVVVTCGGGMVCRYCYPWALIIVRGCWLFTGEGSLSFMWGVIAVEAIS
jgi:hypothetical protein